MGDCDLKYGGMSPVLDDVTITTYLEAMQSFKGFHSEWNLVCPGGWDYQRITQLIGKAAWQKLNEICPFNLELDFDHPLFYPIDGFLQMLVDAHQNRQGRNHGLIAVVAEEETLEDVTENKNLALRLNQIDGLTGALMAPQEVELKNGRVCWRGQPVSVMFMDFSSDVLLSLQKEHDLRPVFQAIEEKRVINPRGLEPLDAKSIFEIITGRCPDRFHEEIVERTPWTRRFYPRRTEGPGGEVIDDLIEWTRSNWTKLVLKPERGYSGHGVRVGAIHNDLDEAVNLALTDGNYIVQKTVPLSIWAEDIPFLEKDGTVSLKTCQTDFRCLIGPNGTLGFICRFGGVPTNVGSGGGVQSLAVLRTDMSIGDAVMRINESIMNMEPGDLRDVTEAQEQMALDYDFTYVLGPIPIALRPRVITEQQIEALKHYSIKLWEDCVILEKMWLAGELDELIKIKDQQLQLAQLQPWGGTRAIIASDGLFNFGAGPKNRS